MIILALDTSGPSAGVALLRDGQIVYSAAVVNRLTHSVNLMPMAEEALLRAGLTTADVDRYAAVVGPGSFTGVRIAVSAAKAMAFARGRACHAVDALEALARGIEDRGRLICPIRDARVRQVYGAAFRGGERLMPDAVLKLEEYLEAIRPLGSEYLFVGDGVAPLRGEITAALGDRARFAPPHLCQLQPGAAALIAWEQRENALSPDQLLPLYLRAPQAERERQARGG